MAVSENVFGNGKSLGLNNGYNNFSISTNGGTGVWAGNNLFGKTVGQPNNVAIVSTGYRDYIVGVPTKSQLGSNLSNSGLIVDTVTIYS